MSKRTLLVGLSILFTLSCFSTPAVATSQYFATFENGLPDEWQDVYGDSASVVEDQKYGSALKIETGADGQGRVEWPVELEAGHIRFEVKVVSTSCCASLNIRDESYNVYQSYDNESWQTQSFTIPAISSSISFRYDTYSGSGYALIDGFRYISAALDTDADFMPDSWEEIQGFDKADHSDGNKDADSDGVSNELEYWFSLDPLNDDSDDDGLSDGFELRFQLDPLDPADASEDIDEDGLTNLQEFENNTSPLLADTDVDGLSDLYEIETSLTDPVLNDTDGDGYSDGYELSVTTDPLDLNDHPEAIKKVAIGFESELGLEWSDVGESFKWARAEEYPFEGSYALRAQVALPKQTAKIRYTGNFDQGTLQFRAKSSVSSSYYYDGLQVSVSGQTNEISNKVLNGWRLYTVPLNQGHRDITFSIKTSSGWTPEDFIVIDGIRYLSIVDDSDSDLMADSWERTNLLDPSNSDDAQLDSDGDGLLNQDEYWVGSNPFLADSDADGMTDGWEARYGLDPMQGSDASEDADEDLLTNLEEYHNGSSPFKADTDSDGLTDAEEVNTYNTNPGMADGDSDGLYDIEEINTTLTDPVLADTDGDGVNDGGEVALNTDPLDTQSVPGRIDDLLELYNVAETSIWKNGEANAKDWGYFKQFNNGRVHTIYGIQNPEAASSIEWTAYFEAGTLTIRLMSGNMDYSIWLDGELYEGSFCCSSYNGLPLQAGAHTIKIEASPGSGESYLGLKYTLYLAASKDADSNNVSDSWEAFYGVDPYYSHSDFDRDSLSDQTEYVEGSSPIDSDTDSDGMPDRWEYDGDLDLLSADDALDDEDNDGLTNVEEFQNGTRLDSTDYDRDGLSDGDEVKVYGSDPKDSDTDNDGVDDGAEVETYGTEPSMSDTDGDSYNDGIEIGLGTDPLESTDQPKVVTEQSFSFEGSVPAEWAVTYGDITVVERDAVDGRYVLTLDSSMASIELNGYFVASTLSFYLNTNEGYARVYTNNGSKTIESGNNGYYSLPIKAGISNLKFELYRGYGDEPPILDAVKIEPADSDGDSLPDYWENANGFDAQNALDAKLDQDGDGLDLAVEYKWGTSDSLADSDEDGMTDFWEVTYGTNPTVNDAEADTDDDNLTNLQEFTSGTNPLMGDSDQDGIPDDWEVQYQLNPLERDSGFDADEDGLSNKDEYLNELNPTVSDTDGDGLLDAWEVRFGTDGKVSDGANDPDKDGFSNSEEQDYGTDPLQKDTDEDGMPDGWEIEHGLNALRAFDAELDYDEDGFTNLQEYANNTNPHKSNTEKETPSAGALIMAFWLLPLLLFGRRQI